MKTPILLIALVCLAGSAGAQERRWEFEMYGGMAAGAASAGKATLPPAGAPIATSNPLFPSREVPSWFFGDGAALVNAVNEEFGGASRVAPLDSLFARAGGARTGTGGARVRRALSHRTSVEVGVNLGNPRVAPENLTAIVESARRSFGDVFTELLRTGPFTSVIVDASGETGTVNRSEIAATVALNTDLGRLGPLTPYLTFGGGVVTGLGAAPAADVEGRYRFSILGQVAIDESDRVAIRFERPLTIAGVIGAGLRHVVAERWTLRFDVRAFVGPDSTRVRVTATPGNQRGSPAGFIESFTNPAIQFSNDPGTGRRSSLTGAALDNVIVFDGGIEARTAVTVGVSRRF